MCETLSNVQTVVIWNKSSLNDLGAQEKNGDIESEIKFIMADFIVCVAIRLKQPKYIKCLFIDSIPFYGRP